jgi:hypothetical protein
MTVREQESLLHELELWRKALGEMSWEARAEAALTLLIRQGRGARGAPAPHPTGEDPVIAAVYALVTPRKERERLEKYLS